MMQMKMRANNVRRGPDFFLLGAMKSGTTSLFQYLIQHPLIQPPHRKELHYYDHKCYDEWSLDDYVGQFPKRTNNIISGEGTAYYLRHPHTAKWIARDFPNAKLIALLRNPVDRAYSHYQQKRRKNREPHSFLEAIQREDELVGSEWIRAREDETYQCRFIQANSYLSRGRYAEQLELWFSQFPREQIHIVFTDDLNTNPQQEVARLFEFLELPTTHLVDTRFREKQRNYASMSHEARIWAEAYFAQHNHRLASLLGRAIPWLATSDAGSGSVDAA